MKTIDMFDGQGEEDVSTTDTPRAMDNSMAALVPIQVEQIGEQRIQTVSARDLWRGLEIGKDFSDWVKVQIRRGKFEKNKHFVVVPLEGDAKSLGNLKRPVEYHFTINAGMHIGLMSQTPKGTEIREHFIRAEEAYRKSIEPSRLQILEMAVDSEKGRLALKAQNEQFEAQAAIDAPKLTLYERAMASTDALSFEQAAKVLGYEGLGQNKLFDFCRDLGLIRPKPHRTPYQQYVNRGYFEVTEQAFDDAQGRARVATKTLIKQRGLAYIHARLTGGPVAVVQRERTILDTLN